MNSINTIPVWLEQNSCPCADCRRVCSLEVQLRANELLCQYLDKEQRYSWETAGKFRARGSKGKLFTINGSGVVGDCIRPMYGDWPVADVALAFLLLVQTDENLYHKIANRPTNQLKLLGVSDK